MASNMATANITAPDIWTNAIPNKSPELVIVSTVFLIITTAFYVTRFVYRWQQRGWDDLMAGLAYLTLVIQTSFLYASAHYGFGKHRTDILPTFPRAMFYFYLYQICYKIIGGFTKLNFCALYLRIFGAKSFQRIVWINVVIIAAGSFAFTIGTIFQCVPIKRNWDRRVEGYCISNLAFWYSHAAFNTLMDICVYLLPIPLIQTLQMKRQAKAGLIAIFGLGAFTIAASVVRMAMLRDSARSTQDPTWGSLNGLMWTEIEANTAVICCCLPALKSLLSKGLKFLLGKAHLTTPENSENPRSQTQGLVHREEVAQPNAAYVCGNRSQARYSPPPKTTRAWLEGFTQPFNHRKVTSGSSDTELTKVEECKASSLNGNTAPVLDASRHYRVHKDFEVKSERASQVQDRVGLQDMLREGPPAVKGRSKL